MKKTFIFYTDWKDYTEEMTLEEKGLFLQTILLYQELKDVGDITPIKFIRSKVKKQLDESNMKREKEVEIRRETGRLGGKASGEARRNKTKQMLQKGSKPKENEAVNDNDNVNVFNLKIKGIKDIFLTEGYLESDLDREATVCFEHYKGQWANKIPSTQYNNWIKKSIQYGNLTKPKKKMEYATLDDD